MGQGSMTPELWAPCLAESEVGEGVQRRKVTSLGGGEGVGMTTARMGPANSDRLDLEAAGLASLSTSQSGKQGL